MIIRIYTPMTIVVFLAYLSMISKLDYLIHRYYSVWWILKPNGWKVFFQKYKTNLVKENNYETIIIGMEVKWYFW